MNFAAIRTLHAAYVGASGQAVGLNMDRERTWAEWLRWRPEAPFTEQDLRDVIFHLHRGIKDGSRNPGALRFRNLIGSPDYFEEELALVRARRWNTRSATSPPRRAPNASCPRAARKTAPHPPPITSPAAWRN